MKEKVVTDDWRESQREATIADSFQLASQQRFGLFGAPGSNALGDDGEYKATKNYKGEDGVTTAPKNFYTGNNKKFGKTRAQEGVHDPGFITNAVGNPYKPAKPAGLRDFQFESYLKFNQEKNWTYAKQCTHPKREITGAHEYKEEGPGPKKKYRDDDGEVQVIPPYPKYSNLKKGRTATSLVIDRSGFYEYQGDDYNAQKKLMGQEQKAHQDTMNAMMGDDFKPFSQRAGRKEWKALTRGNFNTDKAILEEENLPEIPKKHDQPGSKYKKPLPACAFQHDIAFRPGGVKFGKLNTMTDFILKFPEWKQDPPEEKKRRVWEDTDQRGWRVTQNKWSTPCTSVALNTRNLKSSFPSMLKR